METEGKKRKQRQVSSESELGAKPKRKLNKFQTYTEPHTDFSDDEERNRTPSGTVLNKVDDIRAFFLSKAKHLSSDKASSQPTSAENSANHSSVNEDESMVKNKKRKAAKRKTNNKPTPIDHDQHLKAIKAARKHGEDKQHDQSRSEQQSDEESDSASTSLDENETTLLKMLSHHLHEEKQADKTTKSSLEGVIDKQIHQMEEMQEGEGENPQVMKVTSVLEMFRELKEEIVKAGLNQKKQFSDRQEEDLNRALQMEEETITSLKNKSATNQLKIGAVTEVCEKMDTQIKDLSQRIDNLELNNSRKMVIITGLRGVGRDDMLKFLQGFCEEILEVNVTVDDYFYVGNSNPRAIVVFFQSIHDKRLVMQAKSVLKNYKEEKIFINNYTSAPTQEKRRRERDVAEIGKQVFGEEKVQYTKAGLTINGVPYKKLIVPPSPREQINVEPEKMEEILRKNTQRGEVVTKECSTFIAHAASVRVHQDVRDIYLKMKIYSPQC